MIFSVGPDEQDTIRRMAWGFLCTFRRKYSSSVRVFSWVVYRFATWPLLMVLMDE